MSIANSIVTAHSPAPTVLSSQQAAGLRQAHRLLVVEDESRIADFISRGLEHLDVDVTVAGDGHVGEFLACKESFDLVLLDLGLPGRPGIEILGSLRRQGLAVPVIVLTADDQPETRRQVEAAGATAMITKPFRFEQLRSLVVEHLEPDHPHRPIGTPDGAGIWMLTDQRYLGQRMPGAVVEWLTDRGYPPQLIVADTGRLVGALAPTGGADDHSPWAELVAGDVVLVRSRHPFALALLKEAEARGARTVNSWHAITKVTNKVRATLSLARRGLPVPPTFVAAGPEDLAGVPSGLFPLLLKPYQGDNSSGIIEVGSPEELSAVQWPEALLMAQPFLDVGGVDLKLYAVGDTVWAVRRSSPLSSAKSAPEPVEVTPAMRRLMLACAEIFHLPLVGVDVLEAEGGMLIVDVNDFPNYTGIEQAPERIGELLLALADRSVAPVGR